MLLELSEIKPSNEPQETGNQRWLYLPPDRNKRSIWLTRLHDVQLAGSAAFYPDVALHSGFDNCFYAPIREKTMSLAGLSTTKAPDIPHQVTRRFENPVFFFIYNTDNYYHFIYDTLPYLISYLELKKKVPTLKLLMNYPNSQITSIYKFVLEFLTLLGIDSKDIVLADMETCYSQVYLSSSYTHDNNSNVEPREEIYTLYQKLGEECAPSLSGKGPRRIYISRRTWLHGDFSNIGTNYTTRRKLENEDELVNMLASYGFTEIFTENLTTLEKLDYFRHAEIVVGALGGGVCNVLFSPPQTRLLCLVSPTFLDVNARFAYSLNHVQLQWFRDSSHVETGPFKQFMRISCPSRDIVGEITEVGDDTLTVAYTRETVAGWNAQNSFESICLPQSECFALDAGLNSAWRIDLKKFEHALVSAIR